MMMTCPDCKKPEEFSMIEMGSDVNGTFIDTGFLWRSACGEEFDDYEMQGMIEAQNKVLS